MSYEELIKRIARLKSQPQNMGNEYHLTCLCLLKDEADAKRNVELARRTKMLFDFFCKNGQASIMLPSGQTITSPIPKGEGVQLIRNTRWEARRMAEMATPHERVE